MDRCDYVTFRGLTVTAYRERLLDAANVAGLVLDRCSFAVCSSDAAVKVTGRRGTDFDTAVTGCDFSVFTGNAVDVDGGFDAGDPITENVSFLFDKSFTPWLRNNLFVGPVYLAMFFSFSFAGHLWFVSLAGTQAPAVNNFCYVLLCFCCAQSLIKHVFS